MAASFGRLTQRGRYRCGLQPVQCGLQAPVVSQAGAAADEGENLVGRRHHKPRGSQSGIACLHDLARGPDQDVGVPDGRHPVIGDRLDADRDGSRAEVDRRNAMGL